MDQVVETPQYEGWGLNNNLFDYRGPFEVNPFPHRSGRDQALQLLQEKHMRDFSEGWQIIIRVTGMLDSGRAEYYLRKGKQ